MTDSMAVDLIADRAPKLYAVTVTVKDGDRVVTRRYEAPTAEEAKRMAGECDLVAKPKDDDTVEIVTITE